VKIDKIGKIAIIFSFIGISVLYGILLLAEPPLASLDEIARYEGTEVRTTGVITEFRITDAGNVVMEIIDVQTQTELTLFVEPGSGQGSRDLLNLSYGDEIEVRGRVGRFRGDIQLVVSGGAIIKVSPQPESNGDIIFLSQVAVHPDEYEGRKIRLVGYIDDRFTRIFYLRSSSSETGGNRMKVRLMDKETNIAISELEEGDKIIATGIFSYDPRNLRYVLKLIGFERL